MDLSTMSDSDLQSIAGQGGLAAISQGILGQESGNNPNIGSSIDGAIGQAQIMPSTFAQYAKPGEDINNPADNLAVHQRIIQDLSQKAGGDPARIAVGYFSGPGNIAPSDSPTPWKHDRADGNGKTVSSYVSDVLGRVSDAIIPSAQASEMPSADLSHISDEQLAAIAQPDPSGLGSALWAALHIQSQALPDIQPNSQPQMMANAQASLADQGNSGLRGFLAHETAMGANAIAKVPGLKELGSAIAAGLGAGQGDTFGQRYNYLEDAQANMRQAGSQADPVASTLAKIGGTIGGLGVGGEAIGTALPKAASSALASFAAAHPYLANMAAGGVLGAAQGFGDGTDLNSRAINAASSGGISALASLPITYLARNVIAPIVGAIAGKFGSGASSEVAAGASGGVVPPVVGASAATPEATAAVAPEAASAAPEAATAKESLFPMSAGQATQNPELQRAEADAVSGASGEKAQAAANSFRAMQNDAFQEHLDSLAKTQPGGNPATSIGTAAKFIQANEGLASQGVNDAYTAARKLAPGLAAPTSDMQQYLKPAIDEIADAKSFDSGDMNTANALYKKLNVLMSKPEGAPITKLEAWRSMATGATQGAQGSQRYAIGSLVKAYDGYMGDLADRLTSSGDTQTAAGINAFKNAVATRREYGQMFEGNPLVEKLVSGESSIDDITKQFVGSGAIGGKTGMLGNYNALLRASGAQAPQVQSQLQNAFAQNIYNRVTSGKLANSDVEAISPAKMKTELENLFIKQRDFATSLYGADAVQNAQQAIKELGLITSKQANVGNPSNSGYTAMRLLKASGLISHIPVVGKIFEAAKFVGEKSAQQAQADAAAALFAGVVPKTATTPSTGFSSGVATPFVVNSLKQAKGK